jgi:D-alanyl-D-alanine dipeptidase
MLNHAQSLLTQKDSSLHLLIWDAVRPRSAQWKMWYAVKMPLEQKVRYVSNPRNGSIHNYGCAVDLTICKTDGTVLDMGTDFDHFGIEANTNNEAYLLQNQMITKEQLQNRVLLRSVMQSVGFRSISSEWWHFNACSRSLAAANYPIVE